MNENAIDFTRMLEMAQQGDADAENELFVAIEQELRSIAGRLANGRICDGTSLMNEAYYYLFDRAKVKKNLDLKNRRYFFVAVADRMRKILLDREKKMKPGPWDPALDAVLHDFREVTSWDYATLHEVLKEFLRSDDPKKRRRHQLIDLHFFGGMTYRSAAKELGISISQYQIDRDRALAELQQAMNSRKL
ncbi:MAG: hypothetical protein KDB27_33570 [Planctomycetales bacterium]|nr:hypothetical protein [Planctomycetales bacterium]